MNFPSTISSDALKPIAIIFVPGATAIGPYFLIVIHSHYDLWSNYGPILSIVFFISAIAAGFLLEDIGALVESKLWDKFVNNHDHKLYENWQNYLKLTYKDKEEPIGQRYLRTIVLRLKFELSFSLSLIPFLIGVLWLDSNVILFSCSQLIVLVVVLLLLIGYLLWESYNSTELLSELRTLLVKKGKGNAR